MKSQNKFVGLGLGLGFEWKGLRVIGKGEGLMACACAIASVLLPLLLPLLWPWWLPVWGVMVIASASVKCYGWLLRVTGQGKGRLRIISALHMGFVDFLLFVWLVVGCKKSENRWKIFLHEKHEKNCEVKVKLILEWGKWVFLNELCVPTLRCWSFDIETDWGNYFWSETDWENYFWMSYACWHWEVEVLTLKLIGETISGVKLIGQLPTKKPEEQSNNLPECMNMRVSTVWQKCYVLGFSRCQNISGEGFPPKIIS